MNRKEYFIELSNKSGSAAKANTMIRYISSLEQRNAELEQRVKELEGKQLTDLKHDMIQYQGYVQGWNSALSDNPVPPYKIHERIQNNLNK